MMDEHIGPLTLQAYDYVNISQFTNLQVIVGHVRT